LFGQPLDYELQKKQLGSGKKAIYKPDPKKVPNAVFWLKDWFVQYPNSYDIQPSHHTNSQITHHPSDIRRLHCTLQKKQLGSGKKAIYKPDPKKVPNAVFWLKDYPQRLF
jgi:hypothetical protein